MDSATISISVTNESTTISDAEVKKTLAAIQYQLSADFSPVWHIFAKLNFVEKLANALPGSWLLRIIDDLDIPSDLGYHYLTGDGLPVGYVSIERSVNDKTPWSVVASHEVHEVLVDPEVNNTACTSIVDNQNNVVSIRSYSYEICDPCNGNEIAYEINGVRVSNFVYPQWFSTTWWTQNPVHLHLDRQGLIENLFTLLDTSVISILDNSGPLRWLLLSADGTISEQTEANCDGRRLKRTVPKELWKTIVLNSDKLLSANTNN